MTDRFTLGNYLYNARRLRKIAAGEAPAPAPAPKPAPAPAAKPSTPAAPAKPQPRSNKNWLFSDTDAGSGGFYDPEDDSRRDYLYNMRSEQRQRGTGRFARIPYYLNPHNPNNPEFRAAQMRWEAANGFTPGTHNRLMRENFRYGANFDIRFNSNKLGKDPRNSKDVWKEPFIEFFGQVDPESEQNNFSSLIGAANPYRYASRSAKQKWYNKAADAYKPFMFNALYPGFLVSEYVAGDAINNATDKYIDPKKHPGWNLTVKQGANLATGMGAQKALHLGYDWIVPALAGNKGWSGQVGRVLDSPLVRNIGRGAGYLNIGLQNGAALMESGRDLSQESINLANRLQQIKHGRSLRNRFAALGANFVNAASTVGVDTVGTIGGIYNPSLAMLSNGSLIRMVKNYGQLFRNDRANPYGELFDREVKQEIAKDNDILDWFSGGNDTQTVERAVNLYVQPRAEDSNRIALYVQQLQNRGLSEKQITERLRWMVKNRPRYFDASNISDEMRNMSPVELLRLGIKEERAKLAALQNKK